MAPTQVERGVPAPVEEAQESVPPGVLGQVLLARGLVSHSDLQFILMWQRSLKNDWPVRRLGSLLVKAGLLTVRQVADVLGERRSVPAVTDLPRQVAPWLQGMFPRESLQALGAVPLYVAGHTVVVAMEDPEDAGRVAALSSMTGYTVQPVLALQIQIHRLLRSIYLSPSRQQPSSSSLLLPASP